MDFIYPALYCTFVDIVLCTAYFNILILCVAIEIIELSYYICK